MFDMQHVSKTISTLRKERNMTQMELADRLGISFQAVSNWERGQTMPDISKLSELAEIFGVTIDELLGNGKSAHVVEKLIHDQPVQDDLTTDNFLDVAPLVKPRQAEKLFESVKDKLSMKELVMAAPFLPEKMLDTLAVEAAKLEKTLKNMHGLLPFLSHSAIEQSLDSVLENSDEKPSMKELVTVAPFLPKSKLDTMAIEAAKREKSFEGIIGLLPFISHEAIDQCLEYVTADGVDINNLIAAAPFIGKKNVSKLADRVIQDGSVKDLVPLAPFMKKKKLAEAAFHFADKNGFSSILPLLPFLDHEDLNTFFQHKDDDQE